MNLRPAKLVTHAQIRQVHVIVRKAMLTDLLNEISNFLHPFAIGLHNHELVLGPLPLLAHLRAAADQRILSAPMLTIMNKDTQCKPSESKSTHTDSTLLDTTTDSWSPSVLDHELKQVMWPVHLDSL